MAQPARKTTVKSTKSPAVGELIPQPHGGALRNGGTNRGGTGRPPNDFKAFLRKEIRENPERQAALVVAAGDPNSRGFAHAWKLAADYDDEKPAEKHAIVGPIEVRVKIVREGRRTTAS